MNTGTLAHTVNVGERDFISSIYGLLAKGFIISGISTFIILKTSLFPMMFSEEGLSGFGYLALFSPLALLLLQMFNIIPTTANACRGVFWVFVALKGFVLAYLSAIFPAEAIVQAMAVTAAAFGGISLYAYTTKKDLSGMISFLMMAMIGLIVTSIINVFMKSEAVFYAISMISVLVFGGFIAWETQAMKNSYAMVGDGTDEKEILKYSLALNLYISIFGLFRSILNLSSPR